ncbi:pilus assembly protein [uncultured Comamonas sp.]|uniref:pilus assembly protein n=1 Tax=uncultured Comamonas sp. TaxID=114710 RepID=UPI00374A10D8
MAYNNTPQFRKHLLALAACAALAPHSSWALELASGPPGTKEPYVAPNIIISIDDSGSMQYRLDRENQTGASNTQVPNADGSWPVSARRINVLKYALIGNGGSGGVLRDTSLLPDGKVRMSWQAMWNNGNASGADSVDSTTMKTNSMRVLNTSHRDNLISFINGLSAVNGTPSHKMFSQADGYMRRPLSTNSPWASVPGTTGSPYLACRRSYHIIMTDGRWNSTATKPAQTDNTTNLTLPDGTVYGGTTAADRAKSALYRDAFDYTLADWAFYSWAVPPHTTGWTGTMQPTSDYRKAPATETFTNGSTTATLDRYWNPRYNPATWPHMVTYTIGFSALSYTWKQTYNEAKYNISASSSMVPFGYDGSFPDLVNGTKTWPDMNSGGEEVRALDLWHSAINGRGRFYAVQKGEDLEKAFREIFGQINTQTDADLTSSVSSGSNAARYDVATFTAGYQPDSSWKGYVAARTVSKSGTSTPAWENKTTADLLDALTGVTNRLILGWSDQWVTKTSTTSGDKGGVQFKWASDQTYLSTAQKAKIGLASATPIATSGESIVNFIRGDRTLEGSDTTGYTTAKPFRERKSRQGDIINSGVWYTGAPSGTYALQGYSSFVQAQKDRVPMVYVGGNDGMLHGFSATDGSEKLAYIPNGALTSLKNLASSGYTHQYFVDGSPMTGDVELGGVRETTPGNQAYIADWRTLLVGTMGAGGKGYFVLDVTNPAAGSTSSAPSFTAANANTLVRLDRTRGVADPLDCTALTGAQRTACIATAEEDRDIGHITAKPVMDETDFLRTTQITRMNNGRWAAVMGNGYNSTNQRPVLLIQYLDKGQELVRIPVTTATAGTGNANDNGLSAPRLIDLNGDGRIDIAYAGDNLGNIWKFDLTSDVASEWNVAFSGSPLFTARGPSALSSSARTNVQPITVAPTARANDRVKEVTQTDGTKKTVPVGGMMVAFGTGRNVSRNDPSDVLVQSIYSVLDNTRYRVRKTEGSSQWLEVHPGKPCTSSAPAECLAVPAPAALGTGVTTAGLAKRSIAELNIAGGVGGRVDEVDTLDKTTWGTTYNGWYMDLPAVGERALKNLELYDNTNILLAYTQVPAKGQDVDVNRESCDSTSVDSERQYRTMVNIMDGKKPSIQLINLGSNTSFSASDNGNASRAQVDKGSHSQVAASETQMLDISTCTGDRCINNMEALLRMPEQTLRPTWRQLQ